MVAPSLGVLGCEGTSGITFVKGAKSQSFCKDPTLRLLLASRSHMPSGSKQCQLRAGAWKGLAQQDLLSGRTGEAVLAKAPLNVTSPWSPRSFWELLFV